MEPEPKCFDLCKYERGCWPLPGS